MKSDKFSRFVLFFSTKELTPSAGPSLYIVYKPESCASEQFFLLKERPWRAYC